MYTTYRSASFAHALFIAIHTLVWSLILSGALYLSFHVGQEWSFASDKGINALIVLVAVMGVFMYIQFWLYVGKYYVVHVEFRADGRWRVLSDRAYDNGSYLKDSMVLQFSVFESYLDTSSTLEPYIAKCLKLEGYV